MGVQQQTCTSCEADYETYFGKSPKTFESVVYAQLCADYVEFKENNAKYCPFGKTSSGECKKEENCPNGHREDGSCEPLICEFGYATADQKSCNPDPAEKCPYGVNSDGTCLEETVNCVYGKNSDGSCKDPPEPEGEVKEYNNTFPQWAIILIIVIVALILLCLICVLCGCCKKKEKEEKGANPENSVPGNKS
jgi:hypothetical protein